MPRDETINGHHYKKGETGTDNIVDGPNDDLYDWTEMREVLRGEHNPARPTTTAYSYVYFVISTGPFEIFLTD